MKRFLCKQERSFFWACFQSHSKNQKDSVLAAEEQLQYRMELQRISVAKTNKQAKYSNFLWDLNEDVLLMCFNDL